MPYRSDFYKIQNVVGYTGDLLQRRCSVYFEDHLQKLYGRITSGHDVASNNGRGTVKTPQNFCRLNWYYNAALDQGEGHSIEPAISPMESQGAQKIHIEIFDGDMVNCHISRDKFTLLYSSNIKDHRALIEQIIADNPDQKANGQY